MSLHAQPRQPISAADRALFAADGAVCLRQQFDPDWLDFLAEAFEQALAQPGPLAEDYTPAGRPGRFFGDLDMWQRLPAFRRFVMDSPAAEIAGRIMQASRVNFFYDQMFIKAPGTAERTPWHQDQPYWAVSGRQLCSLWLPLDPVPRETALHYVRGSHRWPAHNPHHFIDDTPYAGTGLPELPDIDADPERYELLGWDLEPGDCLVFQAMIVHGSAGNLNSATPRRALATRWAGDDARFVRRAGEVAIPTADPGLAHGDVLDCGLFPRVWSANNDGDPQG